MTVSIANSIPVQPFFAPSEVAEILKLHPRTITNWLKDPTHILSGFKISNQWRISRESFIQYLESEYGQV